MSTYVLAGGIKQGSPERRVVAATMAPAVHGIEAWRFRVVPGLIEVQADPTRFRTVEDPQGRSLHISCGAALLNLRLAAAQLGREPVVRLLPHRSRPTLLATVRLAGPHRTAPFERLLYAATMRPVPEHTQPYGDQRAPLPVLNELAEAARLEGTTLYPVGVEGGAATYVLTTRGDTPMSWLRTGQALQRMLLTAASRMVSTTFLHEVATFPDPTAALPFESGDIAQALVQFGRSALDSRIRETHRL